MAITNPIITLEQLSRYDVKIKQYIKDNSPKGWVLSANAPTSHDVLWVDISNINKPVIKAYNNDSWIVISGSGSGYVASTTAPTNTDLLWIDITNTNKPVMKFYNNETWVLLSGGSGYIKGTNPPTDKDALWLDSEHGALKFYDQTQNAWLALSQGEAGKISVSKTGRIATVEATDFRGTTTVFLTDGADGADGLTPTVKISDINGHWIINDVDTGVRAKGDKGEPGTGFKISEHYSSMNEMVEATPTVDDSSMALLIEDNNGSLFIRVDGYVDPTGVHDGWLEIGAIDPSEIKGEKGDAGENGITPTIDPNTKHWMIGTTDTGIVAQGTNGTNGTNGKDGRDGATPTIGDNKHWIVNGIDTGIIAEGKEGDAGTTPTINEENYHWMIGEVDTGVVAKGNDGLTPSINATNKHWMIGTIDTGIIARGDTPLIDPDSKHWFISGEDTGILATGNKGDKGDDGYSPTAKVVKVGDTATITLTDKNGTTTTTLKDAENAYDDTQVKSDISTLQTNVGTNTTSITKLRSDVDKIIKEGSGLKMEIVEELPEEPHGDRIYLVPNKKTAVQNAYDEYVYIDDKWEMIGSTVVDLTDYVKKTQLATSNVTGLVKVDGTTITVDDKGLIKATQPPIASSTVSGTVKVDNNTVKINDGVISVNSTTEISKESGNSIVAKTDGIYSATVDLSPYKKIADMPTKTSQFTNDGSNGQSTYVEAKDMPTKLSQFTDDIKATTLKAGTVIPDNDTIKIDGNGKIFSTIGANSVSRQKGNQVELKADGIYVDAVNYDDQHASETSTYSSAKIESLFASMPVYKQGDFAQIGDGTYSTGKYSYTVPIVKNLEGLFEVDDENNLIALNDLSLTFTLYFYGGGEYPEAHYNMLQVDGKNIAIGNNKNPETIVSNYEVSHGQKIRCVQYTDSNSYPVQSKVIVALDDGQLVIPPATKNNVGGSKLKHDSEMNEDGTNNYIIQVEEIPIDNTIQYGEVIQYIGENTDYYDCGYMYKLIKIDSNLISVPAYTVYEYEYVGDRNISTVVYDAWGTSGLGYNAGKVYVNDVYIGGAYKGATVSVTLKPNDILKIDGTGSTPTGFRFNMPEHGEWNKIGADVSIPVSKENGNIVEKKDDGIYASVKVSSEDGNSITTKTDGLYVPATKVSAEDGNAITTKTDGFYVPTTKVSATTDNAIESKTDGLYVKKYNVSKANNNSIEIKDDGLYVDSKAEVKANVYADETVLWEGTCAATGSLDLKDNLDNYDHLVICVGNGSWNDGGHTDIWYHKENSTNLCGVEDRSNGITFYLKTDSTNNKKINVSNVASSASGQSYWNANVCPLFKIIGVKYKPSIEMIKDPSNTEDTPVGHIISYFGTTAPAHYLICDGAEYSIDSYPTLANFIKDNYGSYNYFGGDGTTTFAVPDLRGEFLRGSGENSHENQGNGGDVGEHQDATEHMFFSNGGSNGQIVHAPNVNIASINEDNRIGLNNSLWYSNGASASASGYPSYYTSRPTNTSVLYCIKYEPTYCVMTKFEAGTELDVYSEEEMVVGQWIDGKPIYRKTVTINISPAGTNKLNSICKNDFNCDQTINCFMITIDDNSILTPELFNIGNGYLRYLSVLGYANIGSKAVIEYTKTTDTPLDPTSESSSAVVDADAIYDEIFN